MEGKKLIALHYIRKIHAEEIEFYKRREKKLEKRNNSGRILLPKELCAPESCISIYV